MSDYDTVIFGSSENVAGNGPRLAVIYSGWHRG